MLRKVLLKSATLLSLLLFSIIAFAQTCPTANFSFTGTCFNDVTVFNDLSYDPDTNIVSWQWDLGDGNTSTEQNPAHTYLSQGAFPVKLIVTDGTACSDTLTIELNITTISITSINTTHITCFGNCSGSADILVTGGSSPYEFLWSDGFVGSNHTGMCAGNYTVTATNSEGCYTDTSVSIMEPPMLTATTMWTVDNFCFGMCTGEAQVAAQGGVSPYSYMWNDPPLSTMPTVGGLCAGTYIVTVTDSYNCTVVSQVMITQPSLLILNVTSTIGCSGACEGSASVEVWGGDAPYTFLWDNMTTTPLVTGLCSGSYIISVTDANGCTEVAGIQIDTIINGLEVNIETGECLNEYGWLDAFANTSGGSPNYNYAWSNGENGPTANLSAGTFYVSVTDGYGCTEVDSVYIPVLPGDCPNIVSGNIYKDVNDNCIPDITDPKHSLIPVWAQPGNHLRYTDLDGNYTMALDIGNYTITPDLSGFPGYFPCPMGQDSYAVQFLSSDSIITDLNFAYDNNLISGYVYHDENTNCVFDSSDNPIPNALLILDSVGDYTTSDQSGYYEFPVGLGDYSVRWVQNSAVTPLAQQLCPSLVSPPIFTFTTCCDEAQNDFAIEYSDCSILRVNMYSQTLRPCFTRYVNVHYDNIGINTVYNAGIEVELESTMTPQSSSIPWVSQVGNTLFFAIDSVPPLGHGNILLYFDIDCDNTLIGQSGCIKANIYPDTLCVDDDPAWDHSSVEVQGYCDNNTQACFVIYNTGDPVDGDMLGSSEYRVFSNDTLFYTGNFTIAGGDSMEVCFATGGTAIRLEADQRPGHPGNSQPQDIVENCDDPMGSSLGFVNNVPQNDNDPFVDIYCRQYTNSMDPNDKSVVPEGITDNNYIDSLASLEYMIRFQNTGSDTAYTVAIVDTLSQYLDVTSFQQGPSSHTCTYTISDQGVITWVFENIMLPDSSTNEPASNGYVCYKINQVAGNVPGNLIKNRAGIIFDFNEPVITNFTSNIVWKLPIIVTYIPDEKDNRIDVSVYPNPSSETVTFRIKDHIPSATYEIVLYNTLGKEVTRSQSIVEGKIEISANNLSNGVYLFRISADGIESGTGKIVVKR